MKNELIDDNPGHAGMNIDVFKDGNVKNNKTEVILTKDGVLPIACGFLEYFDEKQDKVSLKVDEGSVELTKHLYDFVRLTPQNDSESKGSIERLRQQFMQFSGITKREPKR